VTTLSFAVEDRRYAIDVASVVTVLPVPPLRPLDLAKPSVVGVFAFRGELVPVIDLSIVHAGRPSRRAFSTRVMVVRYPVGDGDRRSLGLVAEDVTDVVDIDEATLGPTPLDAPNAPWLGPVALGPGGSLVQIIGVDRLLPAEVEQMLFSEGERLKADATKHEVAGDRSEERRDRR
jgi:chemotaxis-related protein WspB